MRFNSFEYPSTYDREKDLVPLNKTLKILHVIPTYRPAWRYGGPIYVVHDLCRALVKKGHEVHVFTTNVDGPSHLQVPLNTPVDIDGVKVWYFHSEFLKRISYSKEMRRKLEEIGNQFDVLHIHSVFLWTAVMAAFWAIKNKKPYILEPHGFLVSELFKMKGYLRKKIWLKIWGNRILQKASCVRSATNYETYEMKKILSNKISISTIPHSITTENYPDNEYKSNIRERKGVSEKPYIIFLGRINWKKGLDRLIECMQFVDKADLVIVGNDEAHYEKTLKKIASEKEVLSKVHFWGPAYGNDKELLLQNALLFVLPSYSENFANTVLEAMAANRPVIVTPEVGLSESVELFGCGLVAEGKPEEFAKAINQLLNDDHLRKEMGKIGRNAIEKYFSPDVIASQIERIYQNSIEAKHE